MMEPYLSGMLVSGASLIAIAIGMAIVYLWDKSNNDDNLKARSKKYQQKLNDMSQEDIENVREVETKSFMDSIGYGDKVEEVKPKRNPGRPRKTKTEESVRTRATARSIKE